MKKIILAVALMLTAVSCNSDDDSNDVLGSGGSSSSGYTVDSDLNKAWLHEDSLKMIDGSNEIEGFELQKDTILFEGEDQENWLLDESNVSIARSTMLRYSSISDLDVYYIVDENFTILDSIVNYAESGGRSSSNGYSTITALAYDYSIDKMYLIQRTYYSEEGKKLTNANKHSFATDKKQYEEMQEFLNK